MKRILFILGIMIVLTSCMGKKIQDGDRYVSYGNLKFDNSSWYIHSDKRNRLNIVINEATDFEFSEDLRVVASYSLENEPVDTVYNIHLYDIEEVMSKEPLMLSQLTQLQIDSLGSDPANIVEAWYGGEKYLNISFEVFRYDPYKLHSINLILVEEESDEDNLVFEFRHNAFEDITYYNTFGRVSFDISSVIPDGKTEIGITLKWTDYYLIDRFLSGTFYLPSYSGGTVVTPEVK